MNEPQTNNYEFGGFRLCAVKRLLTKGDGEIIPLTPKVFDLLLYLVRNNGRTIEKDELMREIWTDTIVEESNLSQNISILRRVSGEKRGENQFIVTVPGHGYKFVAEVRRIEEEEKDVAKFALAGELSELSAAAGGFNPAELQISDDKLQNDSKSGIWNLESGITENQIRNPQSAIRNPKSKMARRFNRFEHSRARLSRSLSVARERQA